MCCLLPARWFWSSGEEEGVVIKGGGDAGAVRPVGAEEDRDGVGQAPRRGGRLRRPALEDQHHRPPQVGVMSSIVARDRWADTYIANSLAARPGMAAELAAF